MTNNVFSKSAKKRTLVAAITALVFVLSLVLTIIFGVNFAPTNKNVNSLTVTTQSFFTDEQMVKLEEECEYQIGGNGLTYLYKVDGGRNGYMSEVVYYFAETTDLTHIEKVLNDVFALKKEDSTSFLYGQRVGALKRSETVLSQMPASYVWFGVGMVVLVSLLAFGYVALRSRWDMGIFAAGSVLLSVALTTVLTFVCQIPVNNSTLYAFALSGFVSLLFTLFTFANVRKNKEDKQTPAEELVESCVAKKEIAALAILLLGAIVLVGAIATVSTLWFALAAAVGLVVAVALNLFVLPVLYAPVKALADKAAEKKAGGYVGAKKSKKAEISEEDGIDVTQE